MYSFGERSREREIREKTFPEAAAGKAAFMIGDGSIVSVKTIRLLFSEMDDFVRLNTCSANSLTRGHRLQ